MLEHLPEPERAFAEAARVLRNPEPFDCAQDKPAEGAPGGRFVFLTPNARHPLLVLNQALRWTRGQLVGQFYDRAEADTFPAFYRANTPAQIERLARAAGLKRVAPRRMRVHLVGEYVAL